MFCAILQSICLLLTIHLQSGNGKEYPVSLAKQMQDSTHLTAPVRPRVHAGSTPRSRKDSSLYWKDAGLVLDNARIVDILAECSRWMKVKIIYCGDTPDKRYSGMLNKTLTLEGLFKMLQHYGVKYRVEK